MAEDLNPGTAAPEGGTTESPAPATAPEPAGAPAPAPGTAPSPAADWRGTLPAAWADKLKDMASEADALKALERGMSYTPALKPEDVELRYPEGLTVDKAVSDSFRQFCVDKGITPSQAQALLDWQLAANKEMHDAALASGKAALQKQWGSRFEENSALALKAVTALDKRLGGRLSEALAFTGMSNDPAIVEAFHAVGSLIAEDSLSGGAGAGASDKPESAEDTYKNMFK
ncbi:MAG: hypothetical protein K2N07_10225 [Desulfovibrio sp.]|nr:hypothetical protein [Desulfovibrio sp.]